MNLDAKTSHIKAEFTPDEWPKVRKMLDFMVEHVEEINAGFLKEMIENPHLSPIQIDNRHRNPLL